MPLRLESFEDRHLHLQAHGFVDAARAALARFHTSPARWALTTDDERQIADLTFEDADERVTRSHQRARIVEDGAIAMAGLAMWEAFGHCIVDVLPRGSRADYLVGPDAGGPATAILEVSGTDEGDLHARSTEKLRQVAASPYLSTGGAFVAVTRFADPETLCRAHSREVADG